MYSLVDGAQNVYYCFFVEEGYFGRCIKMALRGIIKSPAEAFIPLVYAFLTLVEFVHGLVTECILGDYLMKTVNVLLN